MNQRTAGRWLVNPTASAPRLRDYGALRVLSHNERADFTSEARDRPVNAIASRSAARLPEIMRDTSCRAVHPIR